MASRISPTALPTAAFASLAFAATAVSAPCSIAADPARADTECTECSNSNSSLAPGDKPFVQSPSGARFADLREGTGATPQPGQTVVVEWVGYTSGYQAKKIESTRETDAPFAFKLGAGEAIPAFEEAVSQMRVGGIRRLEIPGELDFAFEAPPGMVHAVQDLSEEPRESQHSLFGNDSVFHTPLGDGVQCIEEEVRVEMGLDGEQTGMLGLECQCRCSGLGSHTG